MDCLHRWREQVTDVERHTETDFRYRGLVAVKGAMITAMEGQVTGVEGLVADTECLITDIEGLIDEIEEQPTDVEGLVQKVLQVEDADAEWAVGLLVDAAAR
jgi:hypothetical protein